MNQKKEKSRKNRFSRYEQSVSDHLEDSNEQEQEKSGIPNMRHVEDETSEMPPMVSPEERPSADHTRAITSRAPSPHGEEPQAIELCQQEETAWIGGAAPPDSGHELPPKNPNGRAPRRSWLWAVILTAMLLISLAILTMALTLGTRYAGQVETDTDGAEADVGLSADRERVIFIRQYEDGSGLLTTAELYERYADSVVSILAESKTGTGVGSGFFLTEDGYIGTANHVVEGMEKLTVVLSDGTRYDAVLASGNAMTDLAVLKIEGAEFPAVTFGRSAELLTGEKVIAIGTPASLDYAGSVCTGEISYGLRTVRIYRDSTGVLEKKMTLIQTDAPVNPGNSGCPLFDEYGRVIGIVTMKLGNRYAGIGFAIPSDGALPIYRAMIAGEDLTEEMVSAISVLPPKLGLAGEAVRENGIYGVRILRFTEENTEVSHALKSGDLIVEIDGRTVCAVADISAVIDEKSSGDRIFITVVRDGQRLSFEVCLP